jgi:hypothetical protein
MRKVAVVLLVLVLAAGAALAVKHFRHSSPSTPSTSTTSTSAPHYATAPLTGLADPSGVSLTRPALTVKIENTPDALPQWGIDQADVVYEEIVNGGITRLAAVFNSHAPAKVGPVRSVRPTDQQIVFPLGGIFAYSGGAPYAVASISQAPVKLLDESSAGSAMFRDPHRQAPHNLYANAAGLFAFKGTPTPPPALFQYRASNQSAVGPSIAHFTVGFPSIYPVTWTWNATTSSWDRSLFGHPILTGTGVQVSPKNVLVMFVNYVNGVGTFTSYANLQGSGPVWAFIGGREVRGTWSRAAKGDVISYTLANGKPLLLTPGQTWVELQYSGGPMSVTPGVG